VPFELHCACGGNLHGLRQAYTQEAVCRSCGERYFILPLDVYPPPRDPKPVRKKPGTRSGKKSASAAAAVLVEEAGPSLGERLAEWVKQKLAGFRGRVAAAVHRALARLKAIFTPFRLLILLMAAIIAATVYWAAQSRTHEQAEIALKAASEKGFAALAEQDFSTAEREFQAASAALDVLKLDDPRARIVRQMLREATAANGLLERPLTEIIADAQQAVSAAGGPNSPRLATALAEWSEQFQRLYGGEWIVSEATLARIGEGPGPDRVAIDYGLVADGAELVLEGEFPQFAQISPTGEPKQVIVAAQLDSCRLTDAGSNVPRWVISLRPGSIFLWSNRDNCRVLGIVADDITTEAEIGRLLEEQSRVIGVAP
jgi:hypothetical protein